MNKFKVINTKIVASNAHTSIQSVDFIIDKDKYEYLVVQRPICVMVIPIHIKNGKAYTYIVNQYRLPIKKQVWQLPMGGVSDEASAIHQAEEELLEETGLQANKFIKIGEFFVDPGLSTQKCIVIIATDIIDTKSQKLEKTEEDLRCREISIEEFEQKIHDNEISDSWGYSGLYFIQKYLK